MVEYKCKYCKFGPINDKTKYENHLKTKKHVENELKHFDENNICVGCKKELKCKSLYNKHNCIAKQEYIKSNVINGGHHNNLSIKDSYNNTYIVFPEYFKGEQFKHVQQLLSTNVLPMEHKESKLYFNNTIMTLLDSELDPILNKIDNQKELISTETVLKFSKADFDNMTKSEIYQIDKIKEYTKELDNYLLKAYPKYPGTHIDNTLYKGLFPYYNSVYLSMRFWPELVNLSNFKNNLQNNKLYDFNNIKNNNDNVAKCYFHYLISESINKTYISGPKKFRCLLKENDDIYYKSDDYKLTLQKKLKKLTADIISSLIENSDYITDYFIRIGIKDFEFNVEYKEIYEIIESYIR